ncbi:zinc-ribbon domain-containing protein [Sphingosinicellaceae bacterium]|nr:zinc-ribbon domain-containing protein [Sphingosinicellaceae bacterium]
MIVSCPECGARYRLADNAIPADGRAMRCASCKHRWFELGPEPVEIIKLRDLADRPLQPEMPIFPADPSPVAPAADLEATASETRADRPHIDYLIDKEDDDDERPRSHPALKTVLALVLGLGFSAAAAAMWVPNLPTVDLDFSQVPWLERIVAPPVTPRNPVTVRFAVDPQPVVGGRIVFVVTGTVANPTDEPQPVPKLEGRLVDPDGAVSYRWRINLPAAVMLPGQEVAFDASALGTTGERVVVGH